MNNYLKTIFICDGNNDFCLAKNLKKNDVVFPRKNYALYNRLFEKEEKNKILCEAIAWTSGNDIINYLKKLL